MFATAPKDLNAHFERWKSAFDPSERMHFLTAIMMLVNRYAIMLEEKDEEIEKLKYGTRDEESNEEKQSNTKE